MSKPENKKPENKNKAENGKTAAPTAAPTATAAAPTEEKKAKKAKRQRVRFASTTVAGMWCRMFKDVADKFGAPYDSNGVQMVESKAPVGGAKGDKAARKAEKEAAKAAEKAKIAAMTDEEKLAYAKKVREERDAAKKAKANAERDALIAQIKADIAAGKI